MILTVRESFRSLHHRLIRMKLLREHGFGQPTLSYRLLHIRPFSGLVLSAPAAMFMLWYSGLAISTHQRQVTVTKAEEPLTSELFQLHLHDKLTQDARRVLMPEPTVKSELPTYNLVVRNDRLSELDRNLPPDEGRGNYVEALLEHKNRVYEVEARYRGAKHWHWTNPQKSWKVRVKGDHLMFGGLPTFNFLNTPDPMPFNEQMVLDVARGEGLLTPSYYPFRLQLNSAFLGVYFFEAQPDEGLLRQAHRMPGSIYSGAGAPINPDTQVSSLWESAKNWKKVGASGDKEEHDVRELAALLKAVASANAVEFAAFAESSLNLDKFAAFDAIDVVFGNNQHDYNQNHKLYFDPYKNRFEPIATDFRDMEHERQLNRTENPLLLRLKQLPEYLTRRNRKAYELATGICSSASIADRMHHWMDLVAPDQARDPYWDAYELLPVMGNYYRQLVRPMNEERQSLAAQLRLHEQTTRAEYLRKELERLEVTASLTKNDVAGRPAGNAHAANKGAGAKNKPAAPGQFESVLDVAVHGAGAFEWHEARPEFTAGCAPTEWQLFADRDLDGRFDAEHDLRIVAAAAPLLVGKPDLSLYPGVSLRPINPNPFRGRVRAESDVQTYRFFVRSVGCPVQSLALTGKNGVTSAAVSIQAKLSTEPASATTIQCDDHPGFIEPGSKSLHPFCYPVEIDEVIHLGPGIVRVDKTRVFGKHQSLVIEPGTSFHLAKDVSIIAYGKVMAEGRPDAKIEFVGSEGHWGGLALQGPGTAGSRFSNVEFISGTKPELSFFDFPGMVNVHDTRDVRIHGVLFAQNEKSDDALHAAYVEGLELNDVRFSNVRADAVDLEYTTAHVTRMLVSNAGDDGLDLMGSRVELSDSAMLNCHGNGLSIGEHSDVSATRTLAALGTRAVLLKNASTLATSEVLSYANGTAVRLENESLWYVGESTLKLHDTHAVKTTQAVFDGSKSTTKGELSEQLQDADLRELRHVLQIDSWAALEGALDNLKLRREP